MLYAQLCWPWLELTCSWSGPATHRYGALFCAAQPGRGPGLSYAYDSAPAVDRLRYLQNGFPPSAAALAICMAASDSYSHAELCSFNTKAITDHLEIGFH